MQKPLTTYLHDHLAGVAYALDLISALQEQYEGKPLGEFAARLHSEISADKQTLHKIAQSFGPASDVLKDSAAWLSEKISRMKLRHSDSTGLGTFEALEFLALGIHGKALLWRALSEIAPSERALAQFDFRRLIGRAETQERLVEQLRLLLARQTFAKSVPIRHPS